MIQMPWFLPFGSTLAVLLTRSALQRRREAKRDRRKGDWWLLLFLGWIPILAWFASQFLENY